MLGYTGTLNQTGTGSQQRLSETETNLLSETKGEVITPATMPPFEEKAIIKYCLE